jgi:hypothetical protein
VAEKITPVKDTVTKINLKNQPALNEGNIEKTLTKGIMSDKPELLNLKIQTERSCHI